MTRYAAFLRGVNVGGVALKMDEVRRVFTDAGFTAVRTILASGNVVFDSPEAVGAVRAKAEKALRDAFGYDAWVLAYDLGTVAAISEVGIPPANVVFEIIESDHTPDANHLKSLIAYYRQAGFRVALDDLGAGYSSLNLIHQLRPDIMKLDMELIRGIHQDSYKASITEKLLELAQKLGILTVAEGIETPEELRWVREHGVDFVQGYLIARPSSPPTMVTPHYY